MQVILATKEDDLHSVANQADRIHEIGSKTMVLTAGPQSTKTQAVKEDPIEELWKQVAAFD